MVDEIVDIASCVPPVVYRPQFAFVQVDTSAMVTIVQQPDVIDDYLCWLGQRLPITISCSRSGRRPSEEFTNDRMPALLSACFPLVLTSLLKPQACVKTSVRPPFGVTLFHLSAEIHSGSSLAASASSSNLYSASLLRVVRACVAFLIRALRASFSSPLAPSPHG